MEIEGIDYNNQMRNTKLLFYEEPARSMRVLALVSLTSLVAAAFLYPGGTPFSHTASYLPFQNTISDLGMTIGYAGEKILPIQLGLYMLGMGSAAGFLFADAYRYKRYRAVAPIMAALLAAVAIFPSDLASNLHNYLFFLLVLVLTAHSVLVRRFLTTALLAAFIVVLLIVHPSGSDAERTWIATGQKIVVAAVFLSAILSPAPRLQRKVQR